MSELRDTLKEEFKDKETRDVYCSEFLNSSIATQIKVLREQRNLTQAELAGLSGMKQSRVATIEDVNYSAWSVSTLKRIAEAFDLALTVQFDSFGSKLSDIAKFKRETLERPSFDDDPVFQEVIIPFAVTKSSISGTTPTNIANNPPITNDADSNVSIFAKEPSEDINSAPTMSETLGNTIISLAA